MGSGTVSWRCAPFDVMTPAELYATLRLRSAVFVVEQKCVYQDLDGNDPRCHHLLGFVGDRLVASARLLPPGLVGEEASIGRVVSDPGARGMGYGRALMVEAIATVGRLWGPGPIWIGAQAYLERFYGELGFAVCGPGYDEDGIWHVPMIRPRAAPPPA